MGRAELLELLLESRRECEALRAELADRRARSARAGSIAREALELNGVFEAAQRAAEQYVEGVGALAGRPGQAQGAQAQACAQAQQTGAYQQGQAYRPAQAGAYAQGQAYPQAQAQPSPYAQAGSHRQAQAYRPAQPSPYAQPGAHRGRAQPEDPYEAAAMRLAGGGR